MAETAAIANHLDARAELSAAAGLSWLFAREAAALLPLSSRTRVLVRGEDRVRWLNGMVTNTVTGLQPGSHNYSFLLNAQGRIQGDATVFARPGELVLETDAAQRERLLAHLDRFIIMDDVELVPADNEQTPEQAVELRGAGAEAMLRQLGLPVPAPGEFSRTGEGAAATEVVAYPSAEVAHYALWAHDTQTLRQLLLEQGARELAPAPAEALRILEQTPRYGTDITDRHLPQETGVAQALHFSKGCYLGQEIVERIRSRAQVHRGIRRLLLSGSVPTLPAQLTADGQPAGELTSAVPLPQGAEGSFLALGTVRLEAVERGSAFQYSGGTAEPLSSSPTKI